MKKIKFILLMFLMMFFIPKVYAADGVAIDSVTVDSKSDSAVIVSPATFDGLSINFDIKFNDVNDFVKYKLVIKNTTTADYELTESTSSSSYITYEYGYEDGNKILTANSSKTMFITVKYSSSVPASSFSEGKYTETKSITINLDDGTDEITNPSTLDGLYCYLVLLVGTLVFSVALLKATKNKKFLVLVIASMVLIPMNIHAIVKLKLTVESKVEITNPNEITKTIYWALQKNGTVESEICYDVDDCEIIPIDTYKLVISNHKQDGAYKGNFAGTTEFDFDDDTNMLNVPWMADSLNEYVTDVAIEGRVVPKSTAFWFASIGSEMGENTTIDLTNLNTINVTSMFGMFAYGRFSSLNLTNFDTSNVTDMGSMFNQTGVFFASTFNLDISSWNTSKVTNMNSMFLNTGVNASEINIILPETNGNGINNTSTRIYGINDSVYSDTDSKIVIPPANIV